MKEAFTNLLNLINLEMTFLAQLAADVSALKTVVSALGPEVAAAMTEQVAAERGNITSHHRLANPTGCVESEHFANGQLTL